MAHGSLFACLVIAVLSHEIEAKSCSVSMTSIQLIQERGYDLEGQTHVITGGDSGIGEGVAEAIAMAGARVIMLAHDVKKTEAVIANIIKKTGNSKISAIPVNLMSLASVKAAAERVLSQADRVDAVICDAGLLVPLPKHFDVTEDGFSPVVEITYIAHFSLVELLLPKLREAKGRVVFTSTAGFTMASENAGVPKLSIDGLDDLVTNRTDFDNFFVQLRVATWLRYMHTRVIAEMEARSGVTAYAFQPGMTDTPHLGAWAKSTGASAAILCELDPWWLVCSRDPDGTPSSHCPLTPLQGAVSGAYLAAAPKAELESINGALTVACGQQPLGLDPYGDLVARLGQAGVDAYLQGIHEMTVQLVNRGNPVVLSSSQPTLALLSVLSSVMVLFAVLTFFGRQAEKPDESYNLLAADNDA